MEASVLSQESLHIRREDSPQQEDLYHLRVPDTAQCSRLVKVRYPVRWVAAERASSSS